MIRKVKNHDHKKAVNRKKIATEEVAKIGLTLDDELVTVGFVFSHLSVSHITYFGLASLNELCKAYAGIDINIFVQHLIPSCITPLYPVFSISELTRWRNYPLISTNIGTTINALASNAPFIYHYAFDPEFIDKPHIESYDLKKAFCDPRVRLIVRHKSHKELIEEEFGVAACAIIPDCDAEMLVKLVITEMKNGCCNKITCENG